MPTAMPVGKCLSSRIHTFIFSARASASTFLSVSHHVSPQKSSNVRDSRHMALTPQSCMRWICRFVFSQSSPIIQRKGRM